jgi:exodeoxyribonuclease V alpha subunit
MELLCSGKYDDLEWISDTSAGKWNRLLNDAIVSGYWTCFTAQDPSEAMKGLDRFKILCAVNKGSQGVVSINHETERILKRRNLIRRNGSRYPQNYRGKPILITRNQHDLELYNGDLGIVWTASHKDAEDHLYAFFPGPEESPKRFPLYRLPAHETAYAMTVHKSQGSEFEEVLLVLPQPDIPLLTRELLYTAITRAKKKVTLWGSEAVIRSAISRRIERTSGLRDALWGKK